MTVLNVATSGGTDGAVKTAHTLSRSLAQAVPGTGAQVRVGGYGAYSDELTVDFQRDLERAERVEHPSGARGAAALRVDIGRRCRWRSR